MFGFSKILQLFGLKEAKKVIYMSGGIFDVGSVQVNKKFNSAKKEMILEFMNHPVTKEIQAGPSAANTSGTLGGKGNLFSYIGFESSEDPIAPLLAVLLNRTKPSDDAAIFSPSNKQLMLYVINIPTDEEITSASPLPFVSGRSWALGIEQGIPGFSNYLRHKKFNSSRSGTGIQARNSVRSGSFKPISYLTPIFANFINKIK